MTKPNFRIVEISDSERNYEDCYEDFRRDYLNPLISIDDLLEKYSIPKYQYREWSSKIKAEEGLSRKPIYTQSVNKVGVEGIRENQNIYRLAECYGISKFFNGERKYFGKYPDLKTAKKVRNILYENDWDTSLIPSLMEEYGYTKERKVYTEAMKHYDEFKDLYTANPPVSYVNILKRLGITQSMYSVLVTELRKENPNIKKTRRYSYSERKAKPVLVEKKSKVKQRKLRYITKQHNNTYTVTKHKDGVHRSFGTYQTLDEAIKRRDSLEANGWKR